MKSRPPDHPAWSRSADRRSLSRVPTDDLADPAAAGPAVAVVVVSWNTAALLDACLRAFADDHASGFASVMVVDNGSTDGSAELVEERHPWATLKRAPGNVGYGAAVNLGARPGPSPAPRWIVAANADVEPAPGALRTLVAVGDADPGVGVVAPRLLLPDGRTQHHVHPFPSLRATVALHVPGAARVLRTGTVLEGRWDPDRPRDVDWAHGALLLVRRSAFDAVGGFADDRWLYAEDLDLCWRLARAGWRTRYVPQARVVHAVSAATTQAWADEGAREDRKQAAAYAWLRGALGPRRTAVLALAAWMGARMQAARTPAGWRRDALLAHAARHRAGLRARDATTERPA
jgi:N-acetylglucosaminyl-diphospho-decaprenol L-rhamnosyltransferase